MPSIHFTDFYAVRCRKAKRARYVARLGFTEINRRRENRRKRAARTAVANG